MGRVTLTGLERKFERAQALARKAALADEPIQFKTYWGMNDEDKETLRIGVSQALPGDKITPFNDLWEQIAPKLTLSTDTYQISLHALTGQELNELENLLQLAEKHAASLVEQFDMSDREPAAKQFVTEWGNTQLDDDREDTGQDD